MKEKQFIELSSKVLLFMENDKHYTELYNDLLILKIFMFNNPIKQCVQNFIQKFLTLYANLFSRRELVDAFDLLKDYPYFSKIQIYKYLPHNIHPLWSIYLTGLFQYPSTIFGKPYPMLLYLFNQYMPVLTKSQNIKNVLNFIEENPAIMKSSLDDYYDLDKEKELYQRARRNENFKELDDFRNIKPIMDIEQRRNEFIAKRIGNIGELYVYGLFYDSHYTEFVARDIKNGFGYDIYYYNNDEDKENLVEVKTTTIQREDDCFDLSENEYKEMLKCFENEKVSYYVCRVILDNDLIPTILFLTLKDSTTLKSVYTGDEYKICPKEKDYIAFKNTPKHLLQFSSLF